MEEQESFSEQKKATKKQKAPTNKERFQSIEEQMAGLTAAIGRLTAAHNGPPNLSAHAPLPAELDSERTPPHLSCVSTPRPKPPVAVRRALINSFQESHCNVSLIAEPSLNNGDILGDDRANRHVEHITKAATARMPRSNGKPIFDGFLNKVVAYEMPRHFLDTHSPRRNRALDSHDDLTFPEFLQGYMAMLSRMPAHDADYHAMVQWLGPLGQALVNYQWHNVRDWINSVLHDVGQGRISWCDHSTIADRLNATKMRASVKSVTNACVCVVLGLSRRPISAPRQYL